MAHHQKCGLVLMLLFLSLTFINSFVYIFTPDSICIHRDKNEQKHTLRNPYAVAEGKRTCICSYGKDHSFIVVFPYFQYATKREKDFFCIGGCQYLPPIIVCSWKYKKKFTSPHYSNDQACKVTRPGEEFKLTPLVLSFGFD
ncbi:hypothetical protein BX666DRAFT_1254121 [Dichotomocladium elegans]|nr:hypothetical protein BX666DRAFT_1254121 [Dichotomocladium elegans]